MKALKIILIGILSTAVLSACGKKDNSFPARYANGNNAGAGTSANATSSDAAVDSAGVLVDILSLHTTSVSPMTFSANILVGNQYKEVTTTITSVGVPVQGNTTIGSYNVTVTAACANADCNPYYIQADTYLNGQPKIQTGYMFYRLEATATKDRYTRFAAPFKSFTDMVTYLNTLN